MKEELVKWAFLSAFSFVVSILQTHHWIVMIDTTRKELEAKIPKKDWKYGAIEHIWNFAMEVLVIYYVLTSVYILFTGGRA